MLNIEESEKILGIKSIYNIGEEELKAIFRRLIRKNHPDLGGSKDVAQSINEAYSVLKDARIKLDNHKKAVMKQSCKLDIGDLVSIYSNKRVQLRSDKGEIIHIDKTNINDYKVLVAQAVEIYYKGDNLKFKGLSARTTDDKYYVTCSILDKCIDEQPIEIKCNNSIVKSTISLKRKDIKISFNGLATLIVQIERIEYNG